MDLLHHLPGICLLLYAGPDQLMPLLSVLGSIIGVLLIWWQKAKAVFRKVVSFFSRKDSRSSR